MEGLDPTELEMLRLVWICARGQPLDDEEQRAFASLEERGLVQPTARGASTYRLTENGHRAMVGAA